MPLTPDDFRKMALTLPEAIESAHMGHPDFRVRGKIFATLGYPSDTWGMVKLTPEQQRLFVEAEPRALIEWHLGRIRWVDALRADRIRVHGPSKLARALPTWNHLSPAAHTKDAQPRRAATVAAL